MYDHVRVHAHMFLSCTKITSTAKTDAYSWFLHSRCLVGMCQNSQNWQCGVEVNKHWPPSDHLPAKASLHSWVHWRFPFWSAVWDGPQWSHSETGRPQPNSNWAFAKKRATSFLHCYPLPFDISTHLSLCFPTSKLKSHFGTNYAKTCNWRVVLITSLLKHLYVYVHIYI